MTRALQITLLGTGSSGGVPRVGNQWGACDPQNPRNRRRRCACLVERLLDENNRTVVLIDTGADLREQLIAADVQHLDGVLITHSHADHIFGLDDLRQLAIHMGKSITVHMDDATREIVMQAFRYCFHRAPGSSYPTFCNEARIEHGRKITIEGTGGSIVATPLLAEHGDIQALGFRIGDMAYLPDIKRLADQQSVSALDGVRTLVVDTLRYKPHPTHMNLDEALAFIESVGPELAVLTNMHSDLDYRELKKYLPRGVVPGHDGLVLSTDITTD